MPNFHPQIPLKANPYSSSGNNNDNIAFRTPEFDVHNVVCFQLEPWIQVPCIVFVGELTILVSGSKSYTDAFPRVRYESVSGSRCSDGIRTARGPITQRKHTNPKDEDPAPPKSLLCKYLFPRVQNLKFLYSSCCPYQSAFITMLAHGCPYPYPKYCTTKCT